MPEISVIVPVYKVEPYLRECVDSILAQTFTDFEIILVDDGSPDNCGIICDEYAEKDNRIIVIHQENGGLSAARNAGLDVARGEYVSFIDSDDVVSPEYLEILYGQLVNNRCDISICDNIEFTKECSQIEHIVNGYLTVTGRDATKGIYDNKKRVPVMAWGKIYKIKLFENTRFPEGRIHEDNYIVPILLYRSEKVCIVKSKLYAYRQRDNSIMGKKFSIKRYDGIIAIDHCIDYFNEKQDKELVEIAHTQKLLLLYLYNTEAKKEGIHNSVPKQYRVNEMKTLIYLWEHLDGDYFAYQISKYHPDWVLPLEYINKLRKTLRIMRDGE